MSARSAVFLDRDGVLVEPTPHPETGRPEAPHAAGDVVLVPRAAAALEALRAAGWSLVVVSNQPSAAKGTATMDQLREVHARVVELLDEAGAPVDGWRYCFHHPQGRDPALTRSCDCRKPAPGLLLGAARELDLDTAASWMVGDSDEDVEAGRRAGCGTVLVEHPGSVHRRSGDAHPDLRARDLWEAARAIAPGPRPGFA